MSRLNGREIKIIREQLLNRYPEFCFICGKSPQQLGVEKLKLHEIRYIRPLDVDNFIWLCHGCNLSKPMRKDLILRSSTITAEHAKNLEKEPLFRKWLDGEIKKPENNHHLDYYVTIRQAAFEIGVVVDTIKNRYLLALIDHPTSPYVTQANNLGHMQIWEKGYEPKDEDSF